jgi:queuosine biosynthesis protein QueC
MTQSAARLSDDHKLNLASLGAISETALTTDKAIELTASGLPNTFVPGRNLLFFTFAAALACRRGHKHLVGGMCETDYFGYPDCRDDTLKALQVALNLGMEQRFVIHTPLMWIDKAATWALARDLGGERLLGIVRDHSHTCYRGDREKHHEWGYGLPGVPVACGWLGSCRLALDQDMATDPVQCSRPVTREQPLALDVVAKGIAIAGLKQSVFAAMFGNELRVFALRSQRKRSVGPTRARGRLVGGSYGIFTRSGLTVG